MKLIAHTFNSYKYNIHNICKTFDLDHVSQNNCCVQNCMYSATTVLVLETDIKHYSYMYVLAKGGSGLAVIHVEYVSLFQP